MVSMSIEREFFFTYAAVKNLNYNFSALKDLTVSLIIVLKRSFGVSNIFFFNSARICVRNMLQCNLFERYLSPPMFLNLNDVRLRSKLELGNFMN